MSAEKGARCRISVRLKPGAKRNSVTVNDDGAISIAVTSPPVDGKANKHLIALLSKMLRLPKSSFEIVQGHTFRQKLIAVDGLSRQDTLRKLKLS